MASCPASCKLPRAPRPVATTVAARYNQTKETHHKTQRRTTYCPCREGIPTQEPDGAYRSPHRHDQGPKDPTQDVLAHAGRYIENPTVLPGDSTPRTLDSRRDLQLIAGLRSRPTMKELTPDKTLDGFFSDLARAKLRLLVLDYDGTLAPFVARRQDAQLYPGIAPLLETVVSRGTKIAFITGRPARELAVRLPFSRVEIFGAHGYEHLEANGTLVQKGLPAPIAATLSEMTQILVTSGYAQALERKHGMLAIHWRNEEPRTRRALEELGAELRDRLPAGMQVLPFDGGLEFRAIGHHKGTALADLLGRHPGAQVAYLGDDTTDEDAFAALPPEGLGVLVRPDLRATHAHLWLKPPEELRGFLSRWASLGPPARPS